MGSRCWSSCRIVLIILIAGHCRALSIPEGPSELHAKDRGLTQTAVKAAVLSEQGNKYYRAVAERNFHGPVLGYVTPWNNHGYDVATRWRAKFTHISPVWYQLKAAGDAAASQGFQLTGGHDVDQDWIARIRQPIDKEADCGEGDASSQTCKADFTSHAAPRVVPRVIVELAPQQVLTLLQKPGDAIALIVDEVGARGFDGIVLECWLQWSAMGGFRSSNFREAALGFMKRLAANLKDKGKELLIAVPPVVPAQPGRPAADVPDLEHLAADVTGFSLMTYDFSGAPGAPGPNGPLPWQEENVQAMLEDEDSKLVASQVLMGLNFYGYDYLKPEPGSSGPTDARPVMGSAFLAALRKHKPKLKWEPQHSEHKVKYKEGQTRHTVYFPTPASLDARIQLAKHLGIGLSIWELGQGMDAFLDLL